MSSPFFDSQDPTYSPSQHVSPLSLPKRKPSSHTVKTEAGVLIKDEPDSPRLSATNARKKIKEIHDSRMLDDDCGSQQWLEHFLEKHDLDLLDDMPAAGLSDEEQYPESQVPEHDLEMSVCYGVNLSSRSLSKDGVDSYAQKVISELQEQLESTQNTNQKLSVRMERVEIALRAAEKALSTRTTELAESRQEANLLQGQLEFCSRELKEWKSKAQMLRVYLDQRNEALADYKRVYRLLADNLIHGNLSAFGDLLEKASNARRVMGSE
ncbi:hypothetical protein PQX77_001158 [Marasmius sp. AFHP31]|nr:hypothetical protein PQX77_001158 [Marasmius sp. AFHP31]